MNSLHNYSFTMWDRSHTPRTWDEYQGNPVRQEINFYFFFFFFFFFFNFKPTLWANQPKFYTLGAFFLLLLLLIFLWHFFFFFVVVVVVVFVLINHEKSYFFISAENLWKEVWKFCKILLQNIIRFFFFKICEIFHCQIETVCTIFQYQPRVKKFTRM